MKITLDTNVLLSSTFWDGDSSRIVEIIERGEIELVLSRDIIQEFGGVLEYKEIKEKIKDKNLEMKRTVNEIIEMAKIVDPREEFNIIKDDPEDNVIIACAVEGEVDYIVTQDRHLLDLGEFRSVKILTPREFLKVYGAEMEKDDNDEEQEY